MFCMSLNKAECREEIACDERAYLEKFPMTEEQRSGSGPRLYRAAETCANVYYNQDRQPRQAAATGDVRQDVDAADELRRISGNDDHGGRPIEGNRSKGRADMARLIAGMVHRMCLVSVPRWITANA